MKIGIIQFPGSNCERETMLAVKRAGMEPVEFLWNDSAQKLKSLDGYIIVGGFSYEDRSRAGVIAALDPVMKIIQQESEAGKPVLGICNGAQILVESGLVPGLDGQKLGLALTDNKRIKQGKILGTGYYNAWVHMRLSDEFQYNAFTRNLTPNQIFSLPVAHAEGRFIIYPALLAEMQSQGMCLFQYCDADGNIIDEFPINPNGSIQNIAAISNKQGNVMAMMPHPERTISCDPIFHSMREYIQERNFQKVLPLHYSPRFSSLKKYHSTAHQLIVDLIITDNQAKSVENVLNHAGIPVQIKRQVHWEIHCDDETLEKIKASGVLFNSRKEMLLTNKDAHSKNAAVFLVRPKEDFLAQQKLQQLKNHFGVNQIQAMQHGILWQVIADNADDVNRVLKTNLLFNPYAHDYYDY